MNVKIQDVDFKASNDLQNFVTSKVEKLERYYADILDAEVVMTLIKPETKRNKKVRITLSVKGPDLFSEKTADTFEQAADEACEALEIQLKKLKDRISGR